MVGFRRLEGQGFREEGRAEGRGERGAGIGSKV